MPSPPLLGDSPILHSRTPIIILTMMHSSYLISFTNRINSSSPYLLRRTFTSKHSAGLNVAVGFISAMIPTLGTAICICVASGLGAGVVGAGGLISASAGVVGLMDTAAAVVAAAVVLEVVVVKEEEEEEEEEEEAVV